MQCSQGALGDSAGLVAELAANDWHSWGFVKRKSLDSETEKSVRRLVVALLTELPLRVSHDALADVRTSVTMPGAARAAAAATLPVSLATAR